MRLLKMFGLAAIAAAAVMAFVGASSAMAVTELEEVVLCNENTSPCPAGHDFASGTVLHGELETGTKAVLLSSLGTVECKKSNVLGTTTSLLAHGEITALSFSECKVGLTSCTVTVEHLNYLVKGELNAAHTGYETLVTEKGTNGAPQAEVFCAGVIECKYGDNNVLLTAEPNTSDTVLSVLQALGNSSGLLCGLAGPVWHAKYLTRCLNGTGTLVGCWLTME